MRPLDKYAASSKYNYIDRLDKFFYIRAYLKTPIHFIGALLRINYWIMPLIFYTLGKKIGHDIVTEILIAVKAKYPDPENRRHAVLL
ncbi:hypothetical protein BQ8482_111859 [Mesorhizobium delmotii]|uniref:Uncharacterized protein n=1 Tax=Mesorhizobium delmotii TaxID=1631247 RepID=A0A2P9AFL9_9HYPH|nr:hypothetical protein BQ8482_111859 [Mesorhizobium delmotii]